MARQADRRTEETRERKQLLATTALAEWLDRRQADENVAQLQVKAVRQEPGH